MLFFCQDGTLNQNSIFHRKKTVQKTACKPNINLVIADLIY